MNQDEDTAFIARMLALYCSTLLSHCYIEPSAAMVLSDADKFKDFLLGVQKPTADLSSIFIKDSKI